MHNVWRRDNSVFELCVVIFVVVVVALVAAEPIVVIVVVKQRHLLELVVKHVVVRVGVKQRAFRVACLTTTR